MELNKKQPFFSVIVPTYNMEKYIYEALDSVKQQNFDDFEVIIVDDGSTDRTLELCKEYASKDVRFQVYHQENQGPMMARKRALEAAKGSYCLFLDSDDWYEKKLMKTVYDFIQKNECDMVIFNSVSVYRGKTIKHTSITNRNEIWTKERTLIELLRNVALYSMCAKAIKKSVIEEAGQEFYHPIDQLEDYLQSVYYIYHSKKIGISSDHLYLCRRRNVSLSSKQMTLEGMQKIWEVQKQAEEFICQSIGVDKEDLFRCHVHVLCDFMGYIYRINQNRITVKGKVKYLKEARELEVPVRFLEKKYMKEVAFRNRLRVKLFQKRYFKSLILMDAILLRVQKASPTIRKLENFES